MKITIDCYERNFLETEKNLTKDWYAIPSVTEYVIHTIDTNKTYTYYLSSDGQSANLISKK